MARMAQTERHALCDTALQVGEDQPTLCGDWTVKDLVVHLLVREGSPAAAGIVVRPLGGLLEMEYRRVARRDFRVLVEKLRGGPPKLSVFAPAKADETLNTLEFFVHHEDIRRAQEDWRPRTLPDDQQKLLWAHIRRAGRRLVAQAPVGVVLENAVTGSRAELRAGEDTVVVRGLPSELTLYVYGRTGHAQIDLDGTDGARAALSAASWGV